MDGRRLGSLIGAAGGLAFVELSAADVPATWFWRVLGAALASGVVACLLILPSSPPARPDRRGLRLYGWSVTLMVLGILVGARVLSSSGHEDLVRAWVVVAVGLHFVPFTRAFDEPLFARLGWALVAVGGLGLAVAPAWHAAPAASAVAAGLLLLLAALTGLVVGRSAPGPARTS